MPASPDPTTRRRFLQLGAAAPLLAAARRTPNIVILFADDLGYGDLACYGHPAIRTPNLDRMAREGIRFTSFYAAAPVCTPSRAGLMTGRYAVRVGLPNVLGPDSKDGLAAGEVTLAELLKTRGYKTAAIGKWHLGSARKEHLPTSHGFDSYFGLLYSNDMIPPWVKTTRPLELYRDTEPVERLEDQSTLTERYTAEAVRFIRGAGAGPFFLYVPYSMPHLPVSAPRRFRDRSRAGLYGDVIETLDWSAGEILAALEARGLANDTMVIFSSDNGPWQNLPPRMLQKGVEPWHSGSQGLLRGAKATTYEGGLRVPFIARWPGTIPAGQVTAEMASALDLLPAIAGAAGAKLPEGRVYDGVDILPLLRGAAHSPHPAFHYFRGRTLEAIREGPWKCRYARPVQGEGVESGDPVRELFHLDLDPAERYNVYERNRATGDAMLARMRAFAAELGAATA